MDVDDNSVNYVLLPRRAPQLDLPQRPLCHRTFLLSAFSNHTRAHHLVEARTSARFHQRGLHSDSNNCVIRHSNALNNQESSKLNEKTPR